MLNNLAWESLFTGKVTDDDIATAVKATQLQKDAPDILHTLACLYAETGKTKEAHDLLLRAMDDWNLDEPNDEVWYVLGRIAEQYGERDIGPRHPHVNLAPGADAAEGDGRGANDGGAISGPSSGERYCCCCICCKSMKGTGSSGGCCARSTSTLQSSGMGSLRSRAGGCSLASTFTAT